MNNEKVSNALGTVTMSKELEYLTRQAGDAKAALAQTARVMGKNLGESARTHPVIALGAAAVGGALLGRVLAGGGNDHARSDGHATEEPPSLVSGFISDAIKPLIPGLIAAVIAQFQPGDSASERPPRPGVGEV